MAGPHHAQMKVFEMKSIIAGFALLVTSVWAGPPAVGDKAADFTLKTLGGETVTLKSVVKDGEAVVVVLRGFPGYQCPACSRQVGDFLSKADAFARQKTSLVFVYPGDVEDLDAKAKQFLSGRRLPDSVTFLLDPGYAFTNAWGLRWDAVRETAYPSTFVVGTDGVVKSARVSKTHGGRTSASDYLK